MGYIAEIVKRIRGELAKVIVGQEEAVEGLAIEIGRASCRGSV